MSELHLLVVFDTETKVFRVGDLGEMPVDSDASVWDRETEEWRPNTEAEVDVYVDAEGLLISALANLNRERKTFCDADVMAGGGCCLPNGHEGSHRPWR